MAESLEDKYDAHVASFNDSVEKPSISKVSSVSDFKVKSVHLARVVSSHSELGLVGHGGVSSPLCGEFLGFKVCLNEDGHKLLQGCNKSLGVFEVGCKTDVVRLYHHCDKPSCSVCYGRWANREARSIGSVVSDYEVANGVECQHVIVSLCNAESKLAYAEQKALALKRAKARGFLGGCVIPHPYRFRRGVGYFQRFHWHLIGDVVDTFSVCRNCTKARFRDVKTGGGKVVRTLVDSKPCLDCAGFEGLSRRLNRGYVESDGCKIEGDGAIVKIMAARESIFATAKYQLSHAGYDLSGKHRVVSWVGSMAYRSFKHVKRVVPRLVCRICGSALVRSRYLGNVHVGKLGDGSPRFYGDFRENGVFIWARLLVRDKYEEEDGG
ncbi:MAG TPA: hypothetical protein VK536_01565 [Candidatus Limnocylindrales bacterium]|nr:hypothetical protein [Candidatus Limnocylindrales bacterium]